MAKKITTSYSLSKDLYDDVKAYKEENGLSTNSQALERMLLERKFMLKGVVLTATPSQKSKPVTKVTKPKENKDNTFKKTISNIYDSMKD